MAFSGNYLENTGQLAPISRYNEAKMYLGLAQQAGKNVTDSDLNDVSLSLLNTARRLTALAIGDGSPNNGYLIEEASSPSNNFTIKGGGGTVDTAGRLFVDGWPLILLDDADYLDNQPLLHARVSRLSTSSLADDTLEDDGANWAVNALVGRDLVPNIVNPGSVFTITANTATTITVSASMTGTVVAGDYYRVNLSTPGGARTDKVYVDVFLDEIGYADDTALGHLIGAPTATVECARRVRLRGVVRVVEGGVHGGDYDDLNGQHHWIYEVASISRTASANITAAMLSDSRRPIGSLDAATEGDLPPVFEIVSTSGVTSSIAAANPAGDFHTIYQIDATANGKQMNFVFQGALGSNQTTLEWIQIPIWGNGSYRLYVYAEGSGQVYDSTLTATPGTRTVVQVTRFQMTGQPTGEKHFIVKLEVYLDTAEQFNAGALRARHF